MISVSLKFRTRPLLAMCQDSRVLLMFQQRAVLDSVYEIGAATAAGGSCAAPIKSPTLPPCFKQFKPYAYVRHLRQSSRPVRSAPTAEST